MTRLVTTLCALAATVVLAGCGGSDQPDDAAATSSTGPAPTSPSPSGSPSGDPDEPGRETLEPPTVPAEDPPPCAGVRAGIDAFNEGDPEETVRLFEGALPAAEAYARDEPSRTSDLLLQAVRYYAALPPQEYAAALAGSSEFKRHQVTTLAVCRYGEATGGSAPSDDVVPV